MVEIRRLQAHDPIPSGAAVTVMRRFDDQAPRMTIVEMIVAAPGGEEEVSRPARADGTPMTLDEAVDEALQAAARNGLRFVYRIDRTEGARERDIIAHRGDHTVGIEQLDDDDLEDGERGADMRDRRP